MNAFFKFKVWPFETAFGRWYNSFFFENAVVAGSRQVQVSCSAFAYRVPPTGLESSQIGIRWMYGYKLARDGKCQPGRGPIILPMRCFPNLSRWLLCVSIFICCLATILVGCKALQPSGRRKDVRLAFPQRSRVLRIGSQR